jgi:Ras GTPase-activating-like protein IQGAP2/3
MSNRPHPLRQSQTVDHASIARNPSTTSTASSGYSYSSDLSRTSTQYSATSTEQSPISPMSVHRRGKSDGAGLIRARTFEIDALANRQQTQTSPTKKTVGWDHESERTREMEKERDKENLYQNMRQSLRPLSQGPASPPQYSPQSPPQAQPPPRPQHRPSLRHDRGQSLDISKLSLSQRHAGDSGGYSSPLMSPSATSGRSFAMRPTSMMMSRNDNRGSAAIPHAHSPAPQAGIIQTTTIGRPDLESLGKSSTSQLRTLSQLAKDDEGDGLIAAPAQEVVGMRGRRRLQRMDQKHRSTAFGFANWMDKQRQFLQAYEYLCHIGEAKEWIEDVINKTLPPIVELEEALRDGVTLAEVVEALNPDRRFRIFHNPRLQYRHSDNIAIFFRYLDEVELPDLFRFELIDLYEKKNIPKVIHCIHALSWLLFRNGIVSFRIGNLVGQLTFEDHELEAMQKGLDKLGVTMPSFGNMGADFGVEQEPEETEEERTERELGENEASIVELQTQIRGALMRMRLGYMMQDMWDGEDWIVDLQSRIRGDWTRQVMGYRMQMRQFAVKLQSASRGFLARRRQQNTEHVWHSAEPDIVELQSMVRAKKARDQVRRIQSELGSAQRGITGVQAAVKGFLARRRVGDQLEETVLAEEPVKGLQAAIRGMLARNRVGDQLHGICSAQGPVEALQSAIRGMLARNRVGDQLHQISSTQEPVKALQSAIRGMLARNRVGDQLHDISHAQEPVKALQSAIRGMLVRDRVAAQVHETTSSEEPVKDLQSAIRGMLVRDRVESEKAALRDQAPAVVELQSAVRAMLTRNAVHDEQQQLEKFVPQWTELQAAVRGGMARAKTDNLRAEAHEHTPAVTSLQATIRAGAVRQAVATQLKELAETEDAVVQLQGLCRGMMERARVAADQALLDEATPKIVELQGDIRGHLFRQQHHALLAELQSHEPQIEALQAIVRAGWTRQVVGETLAELDDLEDLVVELQAAIRGMLVRARFEEKRRFYNENMQKVVKLQSFVRAKLQGEAYKSLTAGKNPPVNAVKNFVHLLNDSDFDFNEEVEFERMRKTVVQQVRQNEMLEQYIDQIDIKIALLVKNKITLDDVVRHQHAFGGPHSMTLLANSSMSAANQFDLKALNKGSRKKLESYQQLFFNLQTQPQYLARLFRRIREAGTPDKETKRIEHLMMGLFGYAQKRREEYYLLKLMARSIREEADSARSLVEYQRANFFWGRLLSAYTRSPRDRKFLRDLFFPLIRDEIIEDPDLDLESDPMQIYRAVVSNEELATGRPSRRPLDVPREVAIKDDETRELFIEHLQDLREIMNKFLHMLGQMLPRMPYGLRFLCRHMFEALSQRFGREQQQDRLMLAVAHWVWRFYLQPALVAPENYGVVERQLSPLQKRNLGQVAKVLNQVAFGAPFGGDNIYLQPLNKDVERATNRLLVITRTLISVPDAERTFDIDEFNDLYAKNKPTLYIKMADVFAVHNLVATELQHICPSRDDVLRDIMHELGSAKSNEHEMVSAAGQSDILMYLTPRLHDVEDPEADVKALFMETKRTVLYIIRVQTGANLLEILVKPMTPEDEVKWQALLREDFSDEANTRGAYSDANMVDVTRMSYHDLKRNALENIMRLEHMGRISKHNHYQDILNAIALDIRTKSRRRVQRQRELDGVRMTLTNLHEKAKYLEQQRKSYDDYIEQAMSTLQNKKGKRRFLMPFTKQYNHQRELERSGRVPKFGSYKYSARALSEKGVLVSWAGVAEWDKVNLTISCDEVGVFSIEGSKGHIQIPGASALVPIEDLLQAQFEAHQFMNLFEGNLKLNVNLLLHLLYKKFYRTQ